MSIILVKLQIKCNAIYISAKETITLSRLLYHINQLLILASSPKHVPENPLFLNQVGW